MAIENIVIIGAGPAGYTAAIYAARANLAPVLIEGDQPGGQLTITSDVENYPAFPDPIAGPELMEKFKQQAERLGTRMVSGFVEKVDFSKKPYTLTLRDGTAIQAKAVIIATGASARWMGIPAEKRLMGKGVSACATCDGFFFRKMDVAVVGGGDTALEEANFLTRFATSVTVIHRRDKFRASKTMQDRTFKNPKIKVIWDSAVDEILGDKGVTGVRLLNLKTNQKTEIPLQGVFVAIGHEPNTGFLRGSGLKMNDAGYLEVKPGKTATDIPHVYAAGDVCDHYYRQAVTSAGMGCMAAIEAERDLESEGQ